MSAPRTDYWRMYSRCRRKDPTAPLVDVPGSRWRGARPIISRTHYDALMDWKRLKRPQRITLWDLADQWGYDPGYLYYVQRNGIKRYDRERLAELVSIMGECVDEARAQP